ncbi:MAG: hypothetical protein CVU18_14955 [Betaproteobacteria bacterium HGW-Betaproteobacteria-12]|nr:MAG: hypothetical protein CVU18_14955 [Betaproteobacteria bacterium HGW-Betaproteobacteria-12]
MAQAPTSTQLGASRLVQLAKSPRSKRVGLWAAAIILLFGLFGYFAGPPLFKYVLVKQLSQELRREVSIAAIAINPYALSARLEGLAVKAADGREVAGFDALQVNLSSASLFKAAVVVDAIRLDGLRLAVVHEGEGRYDISDLLDEWSKPKAEPSTGVPRFSLNNIELVGGRITFDDRPKDVRHELADINLALPFVSSLPYQAEIFVEPSFSMRFNGSLVDLKGRSRPFAGQKESELDLSVEAFDLAGIQPYLPESVPLRLLAGRFDSDLKIVFKELADATFSLAVIGGARISALKLGERSGQPLLAWKELAVDLEQADLVKRQLAVRRIALDGPEVSLTVNRQGEFNILALIERMTAGAPAKATPAADAPALSWSLGEFTLANGLLRWRDESNPQPVVGEVRNLQARVGRVDSRLVAPIEIPEIAYQVDLGERFRVERMQVKGMRVDLPAHRIEIAEVSNSGTRAQMLRNPQGHIEWVSSPVLKTVRATEAKAGDSRPWIGRVARLDIAGLDFRFEDRQTQALAVQELTGLHLQGENLSNEPGSKGSLSLAGRINKSGSLKLAGSVKLVPLDLALAIETQAIPLLPLQPYFAEQVNIALTAGQFSNKGEATVSLDKGQLKAGYRGSATLGNLLAVDKGNRADFLKWKSLYFGGIDFRLEPLAIGIGEIALSDFFARLILSEAGRLNLQDIVRSKDATVPPASVVPPAAPAPVAAAVVPAAPAKPPVPVKIAKITLQNGTVNFSDYFVKPNYTVNVTRLGGRVTGLSSVEGTVAELDLRGAYAKSAPVQILGQLNPLAAKSYLDIKANVKGVDLTGFSPYSGKYAGYAIEKGKLSLDVAYKLENNTLTADNKVFIDQFTFGEAVESPDATKLPVNLAISLLKNNRGEIDINLPISGSLDDPQFSVGGLIVRVIVNLFVKAVTSPFALLGSMFGDGEELSKLDFAPGRARVGEAQGKTLATLAKALTEREALKLDISGLADPEIDREGLKRVAMERAMREERRKALPEGAQENNRGEFSDEEYKTYLTRVYKAAKFPKPRNVIGMQKDLPVEEMEKLILANTVVGDEDVRQLARRRAENVQVWLIEQGKIAPERLFLVPPKAEAGDVAPGARVDFSLR